MFSVFRLLTHDYHLWSEVVVPGKLGHAVARLTSGTAPLVK